MNKSWGCACVVEREGKSCVKGDKEGINLKFQIFHYERERE